MRILYIGEYVNNTSTYESNEHSDPLSTYSNNDPLLKYNTNYSQPCFSAFCCSHICKSSTFEHTYLFNLLFSMFM